MASKKTSKNTATKKRRLGRGLGSLISAPVSVPSQKDQNHPAVDTTDAIGRDKEIDASRRESTDTTSSKKAPAIRPETAETPTRPGAGSSSRTSEQDDDRLDSDHDTPSVQNLPLDSIIPNRSQPRQIFHDGALDSLASSIKTAGVMQPILVRELDNGKFELIAGERRLRAAQRIPLDHIPAIVHEIDDVTAAEWALIENLQREDLNPMDRAEAFERLIEDHQMSHAELAERVGLIRSSVSNIVRLNDLDPETKAEVRDGTLSASQGKALLAVSSIPDRRRLAKTAIARGWSVRELEKRAAITGRQEPGGKDKSRAIAAASKAKSPHLEDLEEKLGDHLGTRVHIQPGRKKGTGKVILEFYTLDEFDGLMQMMGFEPGSDS